MTVAAITKVWAANDPYANDGLGTSTALGMGFLRTVTVTMNDDVSLALLASDFGFTSLYGPVSIMGNISSNTGFYATAVSTAGMTINAPQSSVVTIIALGRGI